MSLQRKNEVKSPPLNRYRIIPWFLYPATTSGADQVFTRQVLGIEFAEAIIAKFLAAPTARMKLFHRFFRRSVKREINAARITDMIADTKAIHQSPFRNPG